MSCHLLTGSFNNFFVHSFIEFLSRAKHLIISYEYTDEQNTVQALKEWKVLWEN